MNINKIFDGVTNLLSFGSNDKQTQANAQTQTFVSQTAVEGWLANLYRQTENSKTAPFALNFQQQELLSSVGTAKCCLTKRKSKKTPKPIKI